MSSPRDPSTPDPRDPPLVATLRRALAARPPRKIPAHGATPAAVLVALFEPPGGGPSLDEARATRLWLVRRPDAMRTHRGQVALPGGKRDPRDPDLVATALREAEEEIGLPRDRVSLVGVADDYVTITGYHVTPVVGFIDASFTPVPNPAEVARVFSAPFTTFQREGLLRAIPIEALRGLVRTYEVDGETVWGATAAILTSLARRIG